MGKSVEQAVQILRDGGIVIFPTDTAFGIGCVMDDQKAVERLFRIKKRPESKAVPVLVDTVKMAQDFLEPIPQDIVDTLIESYWPGALTIVLQSKIDKVPTLVRGNGTSVGVRIPNHPITRALIRLVGKPVLGPSANFSGGKTPYVATDIDKELIKQVDYVLAGETITQQASTVIDCTSKPWKILREGSVKVDL